MPTEAEKAVNHEKNSLTRVRNRNNKKTISSTQYFHYISFSRPADPASDHHHLPIEDGY